MMIGTRQMTVRHCGNTGFVEVKMGRTNGKCDHTGTQA
jgi:hypothetical protein